jgi:hypothetical protein
MIKIVGDDDHPNRERLTIARRGRLTNARRVKGEYAPWINGILCVE